ncbi:MAG: ABC transporter substrate-binding protein [Candidatus Eisenbacteria bacterium]|uniref:ABC transporter substrate-binding protein n=1 Tax=Eiseniibacteriota bacterium TaxID=2212470 RepID=A0A538UC51_UNCEI|nr:MAG: ABC transporter substrate-binding protein [Candidatus Eisenbacteria bacterium]
MIFPALGVLIGALGLVACGGGSGGAASQELVVGEFGSLTGSDATFGQSTKEGVELAMSELTSQKEGKIGGLKVRTVVEDDQGRPEEAATVVQKLINQDRVITLIGEVASSRSLAAGPICQGAGVPMISPSSTNPKVTQVGDYIFRMCFIDPFQGTVMAKFAAENLHLKKVAILKDVKNDYSVGLAKYFTDAFTQLGGSIITEQAYSAGDQDFRAQLTAIKAKSPEAIFLPGYYTEAGLIARQARELGLKQPILGGDGWESAQLLQIGGDAMNGNYYSNHFAVDNPDPRLQGFLQKYRAQFHHDPDAIGGLAYDAANVLFQSLQKLADSDPKTFQGLSSSHAGSPERKEAEKKLRDIIAGTANFPGVTGNITLDQNRNASKPAVVLAIKDGKKVYDTTVNP